jgi:hypothetical protein
VLIAALVAGDRIEAAQGRFAPMSLDQARRVAAAVADGLDLWGWAQGRVQFLHPTDIGRAARFGLDTWIAAAVNGSDSADPFWTIRGGWAAVRAVFPDVFAVHTRCAGRNDDHSIWAYGPVYVSVLDAVASGHTHQTCCSCGKVAGSMDTELAAELSAIGGVPSIVYAGGSACDFSASDDGYLGAARAFLFAPNPGGAWLSVGGRDVAFVGGGL